MASNLLAMASVTFSTPALSPLVLQQQISGQEAAEVSNTRINKLAWGIRCKLELDMSLTLSLLKTIRCTVSPRKGDARVPLS